MAEFNKLFEPGQIGTLQLKNRIVMAPMGTRLAEGGAVTEQLVNYYVERACKGVGLIITECAYVRIKPGRISISHDEFIPGLKRLADAIHMAGSKVMIQININRGRADPVEPMSPSGLSHPETGKKAKLVNVQDIQKIIKEFGDAAVRAKMAGFDGIQLHGAHGYLLAEFFSPLTNKRTDKYGGSIQNRARLAAEVLGAMKKKTGEAFPIIFRIGATEYIEGGFALDEAITVCKIMQNAGADAIDVDSGGTSGTIESKAWQQLPMGFPRCANVHLAEKIKKAIRIPVLVAGKMNDPYPYLAEKTLELGKADFISFGRALLADPEFVSKTRENRIKDIRPCIACQYCNDRTFTMNSLTCAINPAAGRENEFKLNQAIDPKNIFVIGAGPAGMEAAIVAAERGHRVTIFDKNNELGGLLLLSIKPPHKNEIEDLIFYFEEKLKSSNQW